MSISRWEPFKDFMTLRQAMDRLFEESVIRPVPMWGDGQSRRNLPLDVWATEDAIVSGDAPGRLALIVTVGKSICGSGATGSRG